MVKNTSGGGNAKKQARKFQSNASSSRTILRLSSCPEEEYAVITKMFGNGMCQAITCSGKTLMCHIRGKFRGRNKKQNTVGPGSWILVGVRTWEKDVKNCDLEYIYEAEEIEQLKDNPAINVQLLIVETLKIGAHGANSNTVQPTDNFEFSEFGNTLQQIEQTDNTNEPTVETNNNDYNQEFNFDDI